MVIGDRMRKRMLVTDDEEKGSSGQSPAFSQMSDADSKEIDIIRLEYIFHRNVFRE